LIALFTGKILRYCAIMLEEFQNIDWLIIIPRLTCSECAHIKRRAISKVVEDNDTTLSMELFRP
jgi:hypothetical protein